MKVVFKPGRIATMQSAPVVFNREYTWYLHEMFAGSLVVRICCTELPRRRRSLARD
jgi:hypothetical protein